MFYKVVYQHVQGAVGFLISGWLQIYYGNFQWNFLIG